MFIDHAGAVFELDIWFRVIGRLAFPLFVYLIAEGCRHTKSMEKYLLRLGLFALISEIPFDMAFNRGNINFFANTNIFYTLFLGAASVYAFQYLKSLPNRLFLVFTPVPVLIAAMTAHTFSSDYHYIGVLFIFFTALASEYKYLQLLVIALFSFWLYLPGALQTSFAINPIPLYMLIFCLISIPIVAYANGKRGPSAKYLFYVAYPGHLLLFSLIAMGFWRL